jgi:hypothetical protein
MKAVFAIDRALYDIAEKSIHKKLEEFRVRKMAEWFDVSLETALMTVADVVGSLSTPNCVGDEGGKTFTFEIEADTMAALDELRRHEPDLPSRGRMVLRLIQRAAVARQPNTKPNDDGNGKRAAGLETSEPRQQPRAVDDTAIRAVRRGVKSAIEKRARLCPDCGLNLGLVGERHNCKGTSK